MLSPFRPKLVCFYTRNEWDFISSVAECVLLRRPLLFTTLKPCDLLLVWKSWRGTRVQPSAISVIPEKLRRVSSPLCVCVVPSRNIPVKWPRSLNGVLPAHRYVSRVSIKIVWDHGWKIVFHQWNGCYWVVADPRGKMDNETWRNFGWTQNDNAGQIWPMHDRTWPNGAIKPAKFHVEIRRVTNDATSASLFQTWNWLLVAGTRLRNSILVQKNLGRCSTICALWIRQCVATVWTCNFVGMVSAHVTVVNYDAIACIEGFLRLKQNNRTTLHTHAAVLAYSVP